MEGDSYLKNLIMKEISCHSNQTKIKYKFTLLTEIL